MMVGHSFGERGWAQQVRAFDTICLNGSHDHGDDDGDGHVADCPDADELRTNIYSKSERLSGLQQST